MKYSYAPVFILGILIACLFSFSSYVLISTNPRFKKVIEHAQSDSIRKKLRAFEKGGIERPVNLSSYNVEDVITYAKTFIGTRHCMAGASTKGIDCSGLIMRVHQKYGVMLPHSSHEQARYGRIVAEEDSLQRGDLLFYYNSYKSSNFITHVGIYLGDGTFIHASNKSGVIISKTSDAYWHSKYLFGTRFL